MLKRLFLFFSVNLLVVLTISAILKFFHIGPYLTRYGLNIPSLAIFCLAWGICGALISLLLSKKIAVWTMRLKVIDPSKATLEEQKLVQTVKRLATLAKLPKTPDVAIFHSPMPNAFATGPSKSKSLVAVSTTLLSIMDEGELEGVLGHEISHIANGDMVTMTLIQGVVNAFVMFLARILAFALSSSGKGEKRSSTSYGSYFMTVWLFEIVFMILGSIVVSWFSRKREFKADLGGAKLSSRKNMIAALRALKFESKKSAHSPAFQALMIKPTKKNSALRLFLTHPPLEERIKKLEDNLLLN